MHPSEKIMSASLDMFEALKLAKGRLEMLMRAELPDSDHPSATQYVLNRVNEALEKAQ